MSTIPATRREWTTKHSEYEQAVVEILKKSNAPLTIRELVELIVSRNLVKIRGATPLKTLHATISRKEKRRSEKGLPLLFNKIYEGRTAKYSLRKK